MGDNILEVSEVGFAELQQELQTLQTQLETLTYNQELTNTILLYVIGISAAAIVCMLLYNTIKIFM